jgi:hypothetical protein
MSNPDDELFLLDEEDIVERKAQLAAIQNTEKLRQEQVAKQDKRIAKKQQQKKWHKPKRRRI